LFLNFDEYMRLIITFFLLSLSIYPQESPIKIYNEKIEDGYAIYVDNDAYSAVSVKINFTLFNMESTRGNNRIFVIPPRSKRKNVTNLKRSSSNGAYSYNSNYRYNYGKPVRKSKKKYAYFLPFAKDSSYLLGQGYYNKKSTHKDVAALDFYMPVGSSVHAAREGVVYAVEDNNDGNCFEEACAKLNNYVYIYHSDGTIARYLHIRKGGVIVKVGDEVKKGQFIAFSGNVGYSAGPHLHFEVSALDKKTFKLKSIETKFIINDINNPDFLTEKVKYKRIN